MKKIDFKNLSLSPKIIPIATSLLASTNTLYATTLGANIQTTGTNILTEIKDVYCNSLCWLLLAINGCIVFFSKNDKLIGFAKKALWGTVIVYIILQLLTSGDTLKTTFDEISTWMNG